ncbi:MAG: ferritin-like domain-containing protein [Candidatus Bipolaricaulia bacterium]
MGTVGSSLIKGIDKQEIINALDSFHAYELVVMHWYLAVHNRLEGQAALVLGEMFEGEAEESLGHAKKFAARVAQLGGAVTGDPSRFVEISPLDRFSLPSSNSDVKEILSQAVEGERLAIKAYSEFLEQVKDKDVVTYYEVLEVLKDEIEHEDEIETILSNPDR